MALIAPERVRLARSAAWLATLDAVSAIVEAVLDAVPARVEAASLTALRPEDTAPAAERTPSAAVRATEPMPEPRPEEERSAA
jgi:hypothetical protein